MQLNDMTVIEKTYEVVRDDYIYRAMVGKDYVYLKRTPNRDTTAKRRLSSR